MSAWARSKTVWILALVVGWSLLQGYLGVGSALLGLLLALGIAMWLTAPGAGCRLRMGVLLHLCTRIARDIVVSNFVVARQVLFEIPQLRPAWVDVPLILPDDGRVVALAAIISLTPGTLSVEVVEVMGRRVLRVHVLDAPEPEAVVAAIHARYQDPLLRILE